MKSYDWTLNEIYTKANKQITEMHRRKQKLIKIVFAFAPICLLLVVLLSIGGGMNMGKTPMDDSIHGQESHLGNETEAGVIIENTPVNDTTGDNFVSGNIGIAEPDIFPRAWKKMNAVIVKWEEQNDQTRIEGYYRYNSEEYYSIEYVGVNVEFVTVFSETMSEGLIADNEKVIEQTTYLMIPKFYLEEIEVGDTSLVFLQRVAYIEDTEVLGAMVGQRLAEDKYVPAPIFNIENDKILVPEEAYEINPHNGEYYSFIMNLLQKGNEYVRKKDPSISVEFADGASVEDIAKLFAYLCEDEQ